MENKSFDMGGMINSSAQMVPHCLSAEFALSANIALLYAVCKQTA